MLNNLKKRLKDQRGLTLIELLAVIVILGIIAAIAVPSIGNIIENSKVEAVKADAIQVLNAAKLYQADGGEITTTAIDADELGPYLDNVSAITSYSVKATSATDNTLLVSVTPKDTKIGAITDKNGAAINGAGKGKLPK